MKIPARSDNELLDEYTTYRKRFQSMFSTRYNQIIDHLNRSYLDHENILSESYNLMLTSLLPDFIDQDLSDLILTQLLSLEKHHPHLNTKSSLTLNTEQYKTYNMLCNIWGKLHDKKFPYFFLTGPAGTPLELLSKCWWENYPFSFKS